MSRIRTKSTDYQHNYSLSVLRGFALLLLLSCKPFSVVKNAGGDETLFDKLIARTPQQKVPYPFTELLSYLSQYGKPVGVLIPLGRSLQRHAAAFADPRRAVGFGELEPVAASNKNVTATLSAASMAEFELNGRLFLGYVENTKQIEVMSLLPGQGAFDFQTVENYGRPTMRVQTHSLDACRSCHQHGGPIFTPFSWEETNASQHVAFLLKRHHPQGEVDTIPIDIQPEQREDTGDASSTAVLDPAQAFEDTVTQATNILNDHKLWQMCADAACRARLLSKTFARVNLALSPPDNVNTPSIKPPSAIIEDRFIVSSADLNLFLMLHNETGYRNALSGYALSPAAQSVVAKIKKAPQNFHNPEPEQEGFLQEELLSIFIEATKVIRGEEIQHTSPSLSDAEFETVYTELEKILVHVHRKDLHLQSRLDPQQPRETFVPVAILNTIFGRETDKLFRQQLLLPANKNLQTKAGTLENIELSFLDQDFGKHTSITLYWRSTFFSEPWQTDIRGSCKSPACVFKNFSVQGTLFSDVGFVETTAQVQEFLFNDSIVKGARSPVSKLTISMDNKTYRYELLCHKTMLEMGNEGYLCSAHDPWKLTAAINRLSKNTASPLHENIFNPVMVIKALLAELGYDLKTYAGKIDWRKTHRTSTSYTQSSLLHKDVRKISAKYSSGASLIKRCSGCHDTDAAPLPFLVANSITQLCNNIAAARDNIIDRLDKNNGIGNMPPPHTSQSENFSARERQALLTALQAGKLAFCP